MMVRKIHIEKKRLIIWSPFAGRSAMEAKEQFSDGVGYNWLIN
jgi:hypothetical protein